MFQYNSNLIQTNLEEVWEATPLSFILEDKNWFRNAHSLCKTLSNDYNIDFQKVVGLMAALSPRKSWDLNVKIATKFLETKGAECGHMPHILTKACQIYHNNVNKEEIEIILNGPKIISFFNNILNPIENQHVTIDFHMINLMTGDMSLTDITPKQYDFLKKEFINFAQIKNMIPCELQSSLWVYWRDAKWGRI